MFLVNQRQVLSRFGAFALVVALVFGYISWFQGTPARRKVAPLKVPRLAQVIPKNNALSQSNNTMNIFASYELHWQQSLSQEMDSLRSIMDDPATDGADKAQANALLLDLIRERQQETTIASLLEAKGFSQAAVALSPATAVVIVKAVSLTPVEAAKIADLVTGTTGLSPANISIIPQP